MKQNHNHRLRFLKLSSVMIGSAAAQSATAIRRVVNIQSRGVRSFLEPFKDGAFGPGGRASNSGITATVFGAYGFTGRYLLNELGACGSRCYVPFRGCEMEVRHLKPLFDAGQLGLMPFSTRDEGSVYNSLAHSDVVVNMIGKHYETKHIVPTRRADGTISRINFGMEEVNVTIPRMLARQAREAGVTCFIHLSALSADLESKSEWSASKARGEAAVREEFPNAIIVRPATVFGYEDRFLNWIGEASCRMPFFPLINEGTSLVQPIYAPDLGKALMHIIHRHKEFTGKTFQLAGPAEYTYKEVIEFVHDITSKKVPMIDIPIFIAKATGDLADQLIHPFLTADNVSQMQEDAIESSDPNMLGMKTLGIEPVSMDKVAFGYLHRFRPGGHFVKVQGYYGVGQGPSDAKEYLHNPER